jgi:alkanesulfonate monooxygenase SsuD/methylene tetrahydromethanopterin reductase-like flavin-dependent oxidoreductase (luciferase family)
LRRPHPPILIGGSGETKTLRLVAQYADGCNFFDLPGRYGVDLAHKLEVLRSHCEAVGRDFTTIEKTALTPFDLGDNRAAGRRDLMDHVHQLAALGIDHVIFMSPNFEWGRELDEIVEIVDDVHHIVPNPLGP